MIQKCSSDVQQKKLAKLYEKGNYMANSFTNDDPSQVLLQVFYETSNLALKGSIQRGQIRNRWHNDDETREKTINNEILISTRKKQLGDSREPDHEPRSLLAQSLLSLIQAASTFKSLRSVNLSSSLIGDEGIKILSDARNMCLGSLKELNLAENRFSRKGAGRLAMNTSWKSVKLLNLSDNFIGAEGIRYIAEISVWPALQTLLLKHVSLDSNDSNGAKALSANESWKELQVLYLDENLEPVDNGLMLLAHNNTWTQLQNISISDCAIK